MSSSSSSRSRIRSACSAGLLLVLAAAAPWRGGLAQQQDEALVGQLARLLAAADARAFDAALFRETLHHPDPGVRRQAALAIGRIGDPAGTDLLVEALADSGPAVRAAAAFGLGLLKDARAIEPLLALVRAVPAAEQGPPQSEAVTAIAKIGGDEGAGALHAILGTGSTPGVPTSLAQSTALVEAWRLGTRAPVPSLVGFAEDPDPTARWHALYTLARLRLARGVPALLRALDDSAPFVRAVAARGVSRALVDSARLEAQLADGDGRVVAQALQTLARVVPETDTTLGPRARELLAHPDPAVRSVAADLLARQPATADVDRLIQAYTRAAGDPFDDARLSAVAALGAIARGGAEGRLAVAGRFLGTVPRADDYLVRRLAAERLPDAADRWGPAVPIATGRGPEAYRDAVRRHLLAALRGQPPRVTIETDRGPMVVELYAP